MLVAVTPMVVDALRSALEERVELNVPLERYTSARIGGPADVLVTVQSADELATAARILWDHDAPFLIIGGGSNVLVSDTGVRGVVVLNKARAVRFVQDDEGAWIWAAGVPGTVGGAVFGNAGAFGGDVAGSLRLAEILHHKGGRKEIPAGGLDFSYRSSLLKRRPGEYLVLSASFRLEAKPQKEIEEKMNAYLAHRRSTQPPGASMGSMFKNPTGDYAGRLIEAAGLKGIGLGAARISELHGNFFINEGGARAQDVLALIEMAREKVKKESGVELELEIELVGEWDGESGGRHDG
jgi:UDP-N-acetylmuramate dehydrogenase